VETRWSTSPDSLFVCSFSTSTSTSTHIYILYRTYIPHIYYTHIHILISHSRHTHCALTIQNQTTNQTTHQTTHQTTKTITRYTLYHPIT
jgi:hypothetical protein